MEVWKLIDDYPNYEVSSFGRVRNVNTLRILKFRKHKDGYVRVALYGNKARSEPLVHRLVAQAFIPNPNNYPIINHKDENPANNCVDNLEWCTQKYNINYGNCLSKRSNTRTGVSIHDEKSRKLIAESRKGKPTTKGRIKVSKDTVKKLIEPQELQNYIDLGFKKGW